MIFKIAIKEILGQKRYFLLLVLNLILGLIGFTSLGYFKTAVQNSVAETSKSYLGADISISSRVPFTEAELKILKDNVKTGEQLAANMDVYTMVYAGNLSRLVMLKIVDQGFPFYGEYLMDTPERLFTAKDTSVLFDDPNIAWVSNEVLIQLSVNKGDEINIGSTKVKVTDIVKKDPGGGIGFSGLAPKVYLSPEAFAKSNLLAEKGSTITYRYLLKTLNDEQTDLRVTELQELLPNPAIRVMSHTTANEQTSRALVYLSDYLGLVSLTALFLSGLGMFFLWRNYLQKRLNDFAVYKCIGLVSSKLKAMILTQALLLTVFTSIFVILSSYFLSVTVVEFAKSILPIDLNFNFTLSFVGPVAFMTFAIAVVTQLLVLFPLLSVYGSLKPSQLFSESALKVLPWNKKDLIRYLPLVISFWAFSSLIAQSYRVGTIFFVLFASTLILVMVSSIGLLKIVDVFSSKISGLGAFTIKQLTRQKTQASVLFLTWGLGLALMSFIFTLEANLQKDFSGVDRFKLPNLFLVDIQPDQLSEIDALVKKFNGELNQTAPFIVSRLVSVNGESFEKKDIGSEGLTREEQEEIRFRNRGMNISSRENLAPSERLIKGEWFKTKFDPSLQEFPEVSIEKEYARRFDWELGDKLEFDIQGVPVTAIITSIRQVKWNSFDPNFFVMFQPRVLDDAPQTFLSTVRGVKDGDLMNLQTEMVRAFPSVSVIDIRTVSNQVLTTIDKMSYAIEFMAFLSLLSGLGVFIAVIITQLRTRRKEVNMLKVLGLTSGVITKMLLVEQMLLIGFIAIIGTLAGVALAYVIQGFFFTVEFVVPFSSLSLLLLSFIVFCLLIVYVGFKQILLTKPQEILKSI